MIKAVLAEEVPDVGVKPEAETTRHYEPSAKLPDFYLVLWLDRGQLCAYEQALHRNFGTVLRQLRDGEFAEAEEIWRIAPDEPPENSSKEFAFAWWRALEQDFKLGIDYLPGFIERHLPDVALRHWALIPQGRGRH